MSKGYFRVLGRVWIENSKIYIFFQSEASIDFSEGKIFPGSQSPSSPHEIELNSQQQYETSVRRHIFLQGKSQNH